MTNVGEGGTRPATIPRVQKSRRFADTRSRDVIDVLEFRVGSLSMQSGITPPWRDDTEATCPHSKTDRRFPPAGAASKHTFHRGNASIRFPEKREVGAVREPPALATAHPRLKPGAKITKSFRD
jgi:hypothetical protein